MQKLRVVRSIPVDTYKDSTQTVLTSSHLSQNWYGQILKLSYTNACKLLHLHIYTKNMLILLRTKHNALVNYCCLFVFLQCTPPASIPDRFHRCSRMFVILSLFLLRLATMTPLWNLGFLFGRKTSPWDNNHDLCPEIEDTTTFSYNR